ncbi:hypothetical protein O3M35_008279 [Rhynocoris fuscipes]|uniref:Odorant receptor n=1 Tax=Rhynocoris fuscipes TaxID=488301 RepID=A0AAW1D5S5_9HEMI
MGNFLDKLRSEDCQIVDETIDKEYSVIFKLSGLYPNIKTNKNILYYCIYFILMTMTYFFVGTMYGVTSYLSIDDLPVLIQSVHYCSLNIICFIWLCVINIKRRNLARGFKVIGTKLYDYDYNTDNIRKNIKLSKSFIRKLAIVSPQFYTIFVGSLVEFVIPLFNLITGNLSDKIYTDNGISLNLENPTWVPYGTETTSKRIITWLIKCVDAYGIASVISSGCVLIIELTQIVTIEMEIFIQTMEQLPQRTINLYKVKYGKNINDLTKLKENKELDLCYQYCLKQHVVHYQLIYELFNDTQEVISLPLFCAYIMGAIVLALAASAVAFVSSF